MKNAFHIAILSAVFSLAEPSLALSDGYAVVYDGAVAMKKIPRKGMEEYPWINPNEILTNSCDWAQITYNEVPMRAPMDSYGEAKRSRSSYLYLTGEWCQTSDALLEANYRTQHVIYFREWRGKKYLMLWTRLYQDDEHRDYIAEKQFIDLLELQPLLHDIKQGRDNSGCIWPTNPELEEIKARETLIQVGKDFCFKQGVYLRDLSMSGNKSLQPIAPKDGAPIER
jgi:hypothetical protein